MAVNSSATKGITILGKRIVGWQICPARSILHPSLTVAAASRGRLHVEASTYDKNVEEEVCPAVVPDSVIEQTESDEYWAANPETGVFAPAGEQDETGACACAGGETSSSSSDSSPPNPCPSPSPSPSPTESESVLEQKTFFREDAVEDLDKPPQ